MGVGLGFSAPSRREAARCTRPRTRGEGWETYLPVVLKTVPKTQQVKRRGSPCTCFAASRARRCPSPRTPCSNIAASRARRCPSPRTPCRCVACLPCSHKPEPPHSLHFSRRLPCSQMLEPPHSLHLRRCLPCSQILEPPHSLQSLRTLPCSQMPEPPPCTGFAPSRAHRCSSPRTPCRMCRCLPCSHLRAPALLAPASPPPVRAPVEGLRARLAQKRALAGAVADRPPSLRVPQLKRVPIT